MPPKKSLLDLAEEKTRDNELKSSRLERLELALAVIAGDVTPGQAIAALRAKGYVGGHGASISMMAAVLWSAACRGEVKVTRVK
jgi:hypothetical protein